MRPGPRVLIAANVPEWIVASLYQDLSSVRIVFRRRRDGGILFEVDLSNTEAATLAKALRELSKGETPATYHHFDPAAPPAAGGSEPGGGR